MKRPSKAVVRLRAVAILALAPFIVVGYALFGRSLDLAAGWWVTRRFRRRVAAWIARSWGNTFFRLGLALKGLTYEQRGSVPLQRPLLVVANHQSLLDILVIFYLLRRHSPRFVLRHDLKWGVPNISPATRAAEYAFVDRRPEKRADNLAAIRKLASLLVEDGAAGVIFPEGTWEPEGRPLPLKPAGLKALLGAAPLDVLPVVIDGTWHAQDVPDLLRTLGDLRVTVAVGQVIPAEEARADVDALIARLEAHIRETLAELRGGAKRGS